MIYTQYNIRENNNTKFVRLLNQSNFARSPTIVVNTEREQLSVILRPVVLSRGSSGENRSIDPPPGRDAMSRACSGSKHA